MIKEAYKYVYILQMEKSRTTQDLFRFGIGLFLDNILKVHTLY
jgi:hypothetical protein